MGKSRSAKKIAAGIVIVLLFCFFSVDSVRVKLYGLPPIFCIKAAEYSDGTSASYYGAGYKIMRDYNVSDGSESYHITLWLLPYSVSL